MAIICNLDQAKPQKEEGSKPRTRSQAENPSSESFEEDSPLITLTPTLAMEAAHEIVDVSIVDEPSSHQHLDSKPSEVIDIDNTEMDEDFGRMSLSQEIEDPYNFEQDPTIDDATRQKIANLIKEDIPAKRYTRRSMSIQKDQDTITLDGEEEEQASITDALRRKYGGITAKQNVRRISNKIVPLNSYDLLKFVRLIIVL